MASIVPDYRLRLFMSVDLVGSTAFMVFHAEHVGKNTPNPAWVQEMSRFYRGFPDDVQRAFDNLEQPDNWPSDCGPKLWKTVGDEIIFCCRVLSLDHLALCVSAFVKALDKYGTYLDERPGQPSLDLKGYAWVAAFPFPNVTVRVNNAGPASDEDLPDETTEAEADKEPSRFDFLGKDIDAGFRMGRNCSAESFALSIDLSLLLASYGDRAPLTGLRYSYEGRQVLKGVLNERPYPIICIDVERSELRRKVNHHERKLGGRGELISPIDVHAFAVAFIVEARLSMPTLPVSIAPDGSDLELPREYAEFRKAWERVRKEVEEREQSERAAAEAQETNGSENGDLDPAITDQASAAVQRVTLPFDEVFMRSIAKRITMNKENLDAFRRAQSSFSEAAQQIQRFQDMMGPWRKNPHDGDG